MSKPKKKLYEIFSGEELKIAEKIQQRRLQVLVHSCIYYQDNMSIVTDAQWAKWALELENLQKEYPKIAKKVPWAKEFEDFDHSTGSNLPMAEGWVRSTAKWLEDLNEKHT